MRLRQIYAIPAGVPLRRHVPYIVASAIPHKINYMSQ